MVPGKPLLLASHGSWEPCLLASHGSLRAIIPCKPRLLASHRFCRAMAPGELWLLASESSWRHVAPGESCLVAGDPWLLASRGSWRPVARGWRARGSWRAMAPGEPLPLARHVSWRGTRPGEAYHLMRKNGVCGCESGCSRNHCRTKIMENGVEIRRQSWFKGSAGVPAMNAPKLGACRRWLGPQRAVAPKPEASRQ